MMAAPVLTDVLTSAFLYDLHSITFWVYSGIVTFAVAANLVDAKRQWMKFIDPDEFAYQEWSANRDRRRRWSERYKSENEQAQQIQDGLQEASDHEARGEYILSDTWEMDEFPEQTGHEDDGPDNLDED